MIDNRRDREGFVSRPLSRFPTRRHLLPHFLQIFRHQSFASEREHHLIFPKYVAQLNLGERAHVRKNWKRVSRNSSFADIPQIDDGMSGQEFIHPVFPLELFQNDADAVLGSAANLQEGEQVFFVF